MSKNTMTLVTDSGWILGRHLNAEQAADIIAMHGGLPISINIFRCPAGIIVGVHDEDFDAEFEKADIKESDSVLFKVTHVVKETGKEISTENLTQEQVENILSSVGAVPMEIMFDIDSCKLVTAFRVKNGFIKLEKM